MDQMTSPAPQHIAELIRKSVLSVGEEFNI